MIYLGTIGLTMNFGGTVMIAFSFGNPSGGGHQTDGEDRTIYVFLRPKLFWSGLTVIALGFLQLIPEAVELLRMLSIALAD
jgi:hypothetical protein